MGASTGMTQIDWNDRHEKCFNAATGPVWKAVPSKPRGIAVSVSVPVGTSGCTHWFLRKKLLFALVVPSQANGERHSTVHKEVPCCHDLHRGVVRPLGHSWFMTYKNLSRPTAVVLWILSFTRNIFSAGSLSKWIAFEKRSV